MPPFCLNNMDRVYTDGVIAVKEKSLLGERIKRLCESNADDAFRQLTEYGFGYGAEAATSRDFEQLISFEESAIDAFIKTYAPSTAELDYLMLERDFHNALAVVKAEFLSLELEKMLAPEGTIPVQKLVNALQNSDFKELGILGEAIELAADLFRDEESQPTGAQLGAIFYRAQFRALKKSCAKNAATRALLKRKADMTNLLTAFRSPSEEEAKELYVAGGSLSEKDLAAVFGDGDRVENKFSATPYREFVKACLEAKRAALPFTQAERMLVNSEIESLSRRRFELSGSETFLYYVLRRRLECEDVRVIFVCLNAGMAEADVKKRLRSLREGL